MRSKMKRIQHIQNNQSRSMKAFEYEKLFWRNEISLSRNKYWLSEICQNLVLIFRVLHLFDNMRKHMTQID